MDDLTFNMVLSTIVAYHCMQHPRTQTQTPWFLAVHKHIKKAAFTLQKNWHEQQKGCCQLGWGQERAATKSSILSHLSSCFKFTLPFHSGSV